MEQEKREGILLIREIHGGVSGKRVCAWKGVIIENQFQYNRNGIHKNLYENNPKKGDVFLEGTKKSWKFKCRAAQRTGGAG